MKNLNPPKGLFSGLQHIEVTYSFPEFELKLRCLKDVLEVLEHASEEDLRNTCLFGGMIWPCSVAFSQWLIEPEQKLIEPRKEESVALRDEFLTLARSLHLSRPGRIVELGCGVGPLAVFLAKAFGTRVFATDFEPSLQNLVAHNARENGVEQLVDFACVSWSEEARAESLKILGSLPLRAILASDVIYEHAQLIALPEFARSLMQCCGAELFVLVDPQRYCSTSLLEMLHSTFHSVETVTLAHPQPGQPRLQVVIHFCRLPRAEPARNHKSSKR